MVVIGIWRPISEKTGESVKFKDLYTTGMPKTISIKQPAIGIMQNSFLTKLGDVEAPDA